MLPVINIPFSYVNTLGVGKMNWTGRVLQVLRISNVFAIMPEYYIRRSFRNGRPIWIKHTTHDKR